MTAQTYDNEYVTGGAGYSNGWITGMPGPAIDSIFGFLGSYGGMNTEYNNSFEVGAGPSLSNAGVTPGVTQNMGGATCGCNLVLGGLLRGWSDNLGPDSSSGEAWFQNGSDGTPQIINLQ